jgi:hypothetical protein
MRTSAVDWGILPLHRSREVYRRAVYYIDRILRAATPAQLPPVQEPTKFELANNPKTAKALGLNIPAASHCR